MTLIAAYLGLFVGLIDANAINLALPAIRDSLDGRISGAQWTIDAYNITFAAVLLTTGCLGDRFGRRTLLRLGLVTFIAASLACARPRRCRCCLPPVPWAMAAAVMLPQGLAITAAAFPDPIERGRATAAWAMAAAMSTAIGGDRQRSYGVGRCVRDRLGELIHIVAAMAICPSKPRSLAISRYLSAKSR